MNAERRRYERRTPSERRSLSDRRRAGEVVHAAAETASELVTSVQLPLLRCRRCGSRRLDRSHRAKVERIVTSLLGRKAFRCRMCGWRGWLVD